MLRIERKLGIHDAVATVDLGEEILGPIGAPLDRAAEGARRKQQRRVLRVRIAARAESAAHVRAHDAERVLAEVEDFRELAADRVRVLRRAIQREPAFRKLRDQRTRLERVGDHAVVHHFELHHVRRCSENGITGCAVAHAVKRGDVAVLRHERGRPVHGRIRPRRGRQVGIGRQVVPLHLDEFGCIARLVAGPGHHHGHGIADESRHLGGERMARRDGHFGAVGALVHLRERHGREAGGDDVGTGIDREHPGCGTRGRNIELRDARMRVRRAGERRPSLAFEVDVVGEPALPGEQPCVLDAPHGLADPLARAGLNISDSSHCLKVLRLGDG